MPLKLSDLVKDTANIDLHDICSAWTWLIGEPKKVLLVTVFGDLFLVGQQNEINWLDCGSGTLTRVADSVNEFQSELQNSENFENWFLTPLYMELNKRAVFLKNNEIYGFKKMPVLGGDYVAENVEPTDISVHFALTGQICEQIRNLPPGTKINTATIK